jgi:hypothetical protein
VGRHPDDVTWFINRFFPEHEVAAVYRLLRHDGLSTPRVVRAVLFLSGGRISLLRHYIAACDTDVRGVLTQAEFIDGECAMPMRVRDMSVPFTDPNHSVGIPIEVEMPAPPARLGPRRATSQHHKHLVGRKFVLGKAHYQVAPEQRRAHQVRCFRTRANVVSIVTLPLAFVHEQLAERIELTEARG